MVMVIYHYVDRIWIILGTPNFPYNIYDHEKILSRWTSQYTYTIINNIIQENNGEIADSLGSLPPNSWKESSLSTGIKESLFKMSLN